jgi:PAS domain S-box-containing protein
VTDYDSKERHDRGRTAAPAPAGSDDSLTGAGHRAERALRASEERLRAIFSQSVLGIGITHADGHFEEANEKLCTMLGYTAEEMRARSVADITHPDDVTKTQNQIRRLLDGSTGSYSLEKRYLHKNGRVVWANTTVTLLRHADGAASQFIGIIEDITDRRQAEEARSRLAAVVESSDDAIVTKTLDGIITSWNPGAARHFGYSAEEVVGRTVTLLAPPGHGDEEPALLERIRRGERISHYTTVRRRKDGTLIDVSLSVSPLKDADGRIIGASKIARDITLQKKADEALREQDRRKDEFLATLAHELRNPLAPIRQAALISRSPGATEAQKLWSHDVISRQVQHMSLLLDDLLDISRVTRGMLELRTEMTEISAVVEAAVETARPAIDARRHRFSMQLPAKPVVFAADPLRLAQVLANLLTNAAKYTDPGGAITLTAEADADTITLSVTDTGIGLEHDTLSRVFTMFSQVESTRDRSEGGLGIGLALSKGLVNLHGGTIEAHSAGAGKGSEFRVRLPRHSVPGSGRAQPVTASGKPVTKRRVLIADDNRDAAESLAILLRLEGHEVAVATNGREALSVFQALGPQIALLDIGMPELDGYEVARRIRQSPTGPQTLLIAITGWGQDSDKARATAAGFIHHFTKPIEPSRLFDLLR